MEHSLVQNILLPTYSSFDSLYLHLYYKMVLGNQLFPLMKSLQIPQMYKNLNKNPYLH